MAELARALEKSRSAADRTRRTDEAIEVILFGVAGIVGPNMLPSGSVFVPDAVRECLELKFATRDDETRASINRFYIGPERPGAPARGVAGTAWCTDQTVVVSDVMSSPLYARAPNDPRPHPPYTSLIAVPVHRGDDLMAVVCLEGRTAGCFDDVFAQRVAEVAALFVGSALYLYDPGLARANTGPGVKSA